MQYQIKTAKPDDIATMVAWAGEEGWNPGLHDAKNYAKADPDGFFVGVLDGQVIASISAVKYSDAFGFIGFYIVRPKWRGKGYGLQIWNHAMEYLSECNVGLDGVIDQQDNYKISGFKFKYSNIRYQGSGGGDAPADGGIVKLAALSVDEVIAYDRAFFPVSRPAFLGQWISQPGCVALGFMADSGLSGYGVLRPCQAGYKIGPLYANTPDIAESLFLALKSSVPLNEAVFLDIPDTNPAAIALVDKYKMEKVFETARMYTGSAPDLSSDRTYGVTSFEVG